MVPQVVGVEPKRERVTDEVYKIRKQARQEANKPKTPDRVNLFEDMGSADVPRRIKLPEGEELQRMLENIHPAERVGVLRAIDRFNQEGAGKFRRKIGRNQTGETLYGLRIGNTRVLVYESESSDGVRNFQVIDIDDRSRIYRKNKI